MKKALLVGLGIWIAFKVLSSRPGGVDGALGKVGGLSGLAHSLVNVALIVALAYGAYRAALWTLRVGGRAMKAGFQAAFAVVVDEILGETNQTATASLPRALSQAEQHGWARSHVAAPEPDWAAQEQYAPHNFGPDPAYEM